MPSTELLAEADRQLTICNACRYCEGYCAVFPAMESRSVFAKQDLVYLANLCFECRACYYACPFTPPHEYGVNIPEVLSALRVETYRDYASPRLLSRLFLGNQALVALTVAVAVLLVFGSVLVIQGSGVLFSAEGGEGAFYEVVPYAAMMLPALVLSAYWLVVLGLGGLRFWRETRGPLSRMLDVRSFLRATKDAFGLEYLRGGGAGCSYPGEQPSQTRRWFHQLVFYGVLVDFASTSLAAVYHNLLGRDAPYPYLSAPVLLGTVGGVMIVAGVAGLLWQKGRADRTPADAGMLDIDRLFLHLLSLTAVTGLALLALRDTAAMGTLLTVHLGIVAALYLTLPYGKFAHVVYRYVALIKYQFEESPRREPSSRA